MATIKQIAAEVGTSPSTVSIVLNGKAQERHISEETSSKVLAAAERLGYHPNIAARSLREGASSSDLIIGLVWTQDFRASMILRFWEGLREAIEGLDRKVRLVIYPYTNDHLYELTALTSTSECHAAIICNCSYKDMLFLEQTKLAIPVVLYNRKVDGYCSVNVDDYLIGAKAAEAILARGCKNTLILTGEPVFEGMEHRIHGFNNVAAQCGMKTILSDYCVNSIEGGKEALHQYLAKSNTALPEAIFCGSSRIAYGVFRALYEEGLDLSKHPKVIAVGNGSIPGDENFVPSLSTIDVPIEKMAVECLHLLLSLIDGEIKEPVTVDMETKYYQRESC